MKYPKGVRVWGQNIDWETGKIDQRTRRNWSEMLASENVEGTLYFWPKLVFIDETWTKLRSDGIFPEKWYKMWKKKFQYQLKIIHVLGCSSIGWRKVSITMPWQNYQERLYENFWRLWSLFGECFQQGNTPIHKSHIFKELFKSGTGQPRFESYWEYVGYYQEKIAKTSCWLEKCKQSAGKQKFPSITSIKVTWRKLNPTSALSLDINIFLLWLE